MPIKHKLRNQIYTVNQQQKKLRKNYYFSHLVMVTQSSVLMHNVQLLRKHWKKLKNNLKIKQQLSLIKTPPKVSQKEEDLMMKDY